MTSTHRLGVAAAEGIQPANWRRALLAPSRLAGKKYADLEIVRAVCALLVVVNHFYARTTGLHQFVPISMITNYATEAVIGFFVLSGVVISLQDYNNIAKYIKARAIRILPIYYIALGVTAVVTITCDGSASIRQFLLNGMFLQEFPGSGAHLLGYDQPTWSLPYEAFYYILFVAVILNGRCLFALLFASFALGMAVEVIDPAGTFKYLDTIVPFFTYWAIGVVVVRAARSGIYPSPSSGVFGFLAGLCLSRCPLSDNYYDFFRLLGFALGIGLLISSLVGRDLHVSDDGGFRYRPYEIPAAARVLVALIVVLVLWRWSPAIAPTKLVLSLLIGLGAVHPSLFVSIAAWFFARTKSVFVYIGGLSYALYLIHFPLLLLANKYLSAFEVWPRMMITGVFVFALAHLLEFVLQPRIKKLLSSPVHLRTAA